jgi:hypothetical protein
VDCGDCLVLFTDIIVYADKTVTGMYQLKHVVPIREMKVTKGEGTIIDLKAKSGKSFPVQASSAEERDGWFAALTKAIDSIDAQVNSVTGDNTGAGNAPLSGIAAQKGASSGTKLASMLVGKTDA